MKSSLSDKSKWNIPYLIKLIRKMIHNKSRARLIIEIESCGIVKIAKYEHMEPDESDVQRFFYPSLYYRMIFNDSFCNIVPLLSVIIR